MELEHLINVAAGRKPADLVLHRCRLINVLSDEIEEGVDIAITEGRIAGVGPHYEGDEVVDLAGQYVAPGFIDGHVHIESSMLSAREFSNVVCAHGTTAVIADPHEIANVMGTEGIRFMLASSKYCPVYVYIMLSSCVPASPLESSGAELNAVDLLPLMGDPWVLGLAEMMNYPGVINLDEDVIDKLKVARGTIIDGHAPGLTGLNLQAYAAAGIRSDHECTTLEEAREKLRAGLYIMIREGSQARNLDALLPLITPATAERFMFVTDDRDTEDLMNEGHIDYMIRRALKYGIKPTIAVRLATHNAARYFGIKSVGAVAPGYHAALAVIDNLEDFNVTQVYQGGRLVARDGVCVDDSPSPRLPVLRSAVNIHWLEPQQFEVKAPALASDGKPPTTQRVHVIELVPGQIVTQRSVEELPVVDGVVMPDPAKDVLKIAVIDRHQASGRMGLGFVRGFGLTAGALASTVAHDSHNVIVAGTNDQDLFEAAVHIARVRGGMCVVRDGKVLADLPLPIAGLMGQYKAPELLERLQKLNAAAAELGSKLRRPFMAMAFLSLSVIGSLKITDKGLIDVEQFEPIELLVP